MTGPLNSLNLSVCVSMNFSNFPNIERNWGAGAVSQQLSVHDALVEDRVEFLVPTMHSTTKL